MMAAVQAYLALRRAAGFEMINAGYLLASYAEFSTERNETHVTTETAIAWASKAQSVAQRDERLNTICRFVRFIRPEDPRHELPPANHFGWHKRRRVPYIYSDGEIKRLVEAAGQIGPADTLRPHTYSTLLALLAATGLRVSEALHLRIADITLDGLLIRATKFKKTRLVPLHATAAAGLRRYVTRRRQIGACDDHVFITDHGQPLPYQTVHCAFQRIKKAAGLSSSQTGRHPRLHDIRHAFAVKALRASPVGRNRIGEHMVALSTYLGHVNIHATYWYLEATSELLQDIAEVGDSFMSEGEPL
jgi:integrase